LRKRARLSGRNILVVLGIAGTVAAAACAGPASREDPAARDRPRQNLLLPNLDDDNGDGLPDASAAPLAAGADDDMLQIRVFPGRRLPEGSVIRVEIAEPWTRFARAFILRPTPEGPRFQPPPADASAGKVRKEGAVIGVEAADFPAPDRPPTLEVKVSFETRTGRPLHDERILCAVAPFLLSSCLDPADSVQVVKTKGTERFVRDLGPLVEAAGARLEIIEDPSLPEHDIWIQDAV